MLRCFSLIYCFFNPNQHIVIGKSNWVVWDLFEYSNHKSRYVTFQNYDTYKDIHLNYIKNKTDASLSTIYEAILSASAGTPVKIVSLLDYTNGADVLIAQQKVNSLNKLKDKKVGVEYGSISTLRH